MWDKFHSDGRQTAPAAHPGDTIALELTLSENPNDAISARVGFASDKNIFEFIEAANLHPDIPIPLPSHDAAMFGLININGLATGPIGSISLKVAPDAPLGSYLVKPQPDGVLVRDPHGDHPRNRTQLHHRRDCPHLYRDRQFRGQALLRMRQRDRQAERGRRFGALLGRWRDHQGIHNRRRRKDLHLRGL